MIREADRMRAAGGRAGGGRRSTSRGGTDEALARSSSAARRQTCSGLKSLSVMSSLDAAIDAYKVNDPHLMALQFFPAVKAL